jgi:hypothetical protein
MKIKLFWFGVLLCFEMASVADAATTTYYFSGIVSSVDAGEVPVPELGNPTVTGSGVAAVGTRFFGQYTFDNAWSPSSFSSPPINAVYVSDINSPTYMAAINLGGVGFSFFGLAVETSRSAYDVYNNFLGNQLGAGGGSGTGNGQPLSYGYWLLELRKASAGGSLVPLSPVPLLSDFTSTMFVLAAYDQGPAFDGSNGRGHVYRGTIDYLSDAPGPSPIPLPPSILLQLTAFSLLGLLAWRRKRQPIGAE